MRIPERIKLRLFDVIAPRLARDIAAQMTQAQGLMRQGQVEAAVTTFAKAAERDGRVYCRNWNMDRHREDTAHTIIRNRMQRRLKNWYMGDGPRTAPPVARLADKLALRQWGEGQTEVRLPKALGYFERFADVPWADWQDASVVIKPRHGEMARGVMVLAGGEDLMRQATVGPDLGAYAARVWEEQAVEDGPVVVEELVQDPMRKSDPVVRIPRDFKGFCANGRVAFVTVQDTNGPGGYQAFRYRRSFDSTGAPLPRAHATVDDVGGPQTPMGFATIVAEMERLSTMFPQALRFDLFLGEDGPVLGEITTYPNAGLNYTPFAARTFLQMLEATGERGQ